MLGPHEFERAVETAFAKGRVTERQLRDIVARAPGRRGGKGLAALLDYRGDDGYTLSRAEDIMRSLQRRARLPRFRTNVKVGRYRVDFLFPVAKVIIEVDSWAYHSSRVLRGRSPPLGRPAADGLPSRAGHLADAPARGRGDGRPDRRGHRSSLGGMRLAKYLAHAGVASRRASEEIIRAGRVAVNGDPITDPATDVSEADTVELDGTAITHEDRVVYMLNKPKGVLSTASDTHGRPTVVSMIASDKRLYPVGRLDADTTGLILLTNDGELANRLMHPRYEVPRTYRARVEGRPGGAALRRLREGIELDDGRTSPAAVRSTGDVVELTIHEGRKRQVRRMLEAVGHPVIELERTALGPLRLRGLEPGESRRLTPAEVETLWKNQSP